MKTPAHIVFSGGVTGGHLFPGLAVAERIVQADPNARITFCGPGGALDRREVARAGYAYHEVLCPTAPRGVWRFPRFAQRMLQAQWAADAFLRRHAVSAVVGLGGYASAPLALAAARRRAPLVLLEQNSVLGRANRWLSRWAQALCLAFDETTHMSSRQRCLTVVTGTPIRSEFRRNDNQRNRERLLVILGGSGGARALNEAAPWAIAGLGALIAGWRVVHQAGPSAQAATQAAYAEAGARATVVPFITEMAEALARASLTLCRAGGSTLAELAATRSPALLVPFPQATDDHQRQNALRFARAAALVDSQGLSPARLAARLGEELSQLLPDHARRQQMAQAMATLARPDAAQAVSEIVRRIAENGGSSSAAGTDFQLASKIASPPHLPTFD